MNAWNGLKVFRRVLVNYSEQRALKVCLHERRDDALAVGSLEDAGPLLDHAFRGPHRGRRGTQVTTANRPARLL